MRSRWAVAPVAMVGAASLSFFGASPITASAVTAVARQSPGAPAIQQARFLGVGTLSGHGTATSAGGVNDATPQLHQRPSTAQRKAPTTSSPSAGIPNPAGRNVSTRGRFSGFNGLDHADQRLAGTGVYHNTQFSLEPPDQGLCVGSGFILEQVNTAFQIFDTSGNALSAPVAFNQFFGVAPEIIRTTNPPTIGDFVSDPKCTFDPATNRWFMTMLQADAPGLCQVGPFNSVVPCSRAHTFVAVSKTSDPTAQWNLFSIDATDDGTNGTPNNSTSTITCPCFGDQPLLGLNADALVISTNEYGVATNANTNPGNPETGGQIYAISKSALLSAPTTVLPTVVHLNAGATPMVGGDCCVPFDSIQPAIAPTASGQTTGFEYLLSSFTNHPGVTTAINVWALTGTDTLTAATPNVSLQRVELPSEAYAFDAPFSPPGLGNLVATQKEGPRPLADLIGGAPLPLLNGNDVRMQQVVFANGKLWAGLNTALVSDNPDVQRAGIAYFVVTPHFNNSALSASMFKQGYVAVNGESTIFPSIAVNQSGIGAMAFTLVGPDFFPSSAYILIRPTGNLAGNVVIAGAGAGPDDGFTGYPALSGNPGIVGRWGDYSAAVTDANGTVWLASEYIPNAPRTVLANWGTFITNTGG